MISFRAAFWLRCLIFLVLGVCALAQSGRFIVRSQRPGGFLWSIASDGNAKLVTVGTGGRILTSTDGVVWNARASGVTDWLVGVAWGYDGSGSV